MLSFFSKMSDAAKGATFGAGGAGAAGLVAMNTPAVSGWTIALLCLGVFVVVFVVFLLFIKLMHRRRSGGLWRGLTEGVIRGQFFENLERYRSKYKDVDQWPWFLVMGAPGSGKSYALRKSEMDWDSGTDINQGEGGTKFIDWWMSQEGIFLDTAGRYTDLIAEENGESDQQIEERMKQLKEFLGLLRKNRPTCPINGLVLVISAVDLQVKSPEERLMDARKLRRTLHLVQDALQVRFPLIVWVTKCDKIPGFVDYFKPVANNRNPAVRQQMMGWSKPGSLADISEPFSMAQLNEFLRGLVRDLKSQRNELLDSLGGAADLRTSSSLYLFPDEFGRLLGLNESETGAQKPLEAYLSAVFREPEDARQRERIREKPPFFRGIYFTSAITEGEELDRRRAELEKRSLLQVVQEEQTKVKQHVPLFSFQTPFFFKDSIVRKLVKEKNLVTRYGNALRGLRLTIGLITASIVLAFVAMGLAGWVMKADMEKSVGMEAKLWSFLSEGIKSNPANIKLVVAENNRVYYRGSANRPENLSGETTLETYEDLHERVQHDLGSSLIFRPFHSSSVSRQSRQIAWSKAAGSHALEPIFAEAAARVGQVGDWKKEEAFALPAMTALINWEGVRSFGQPFDRAKMDIMGPLVRFMVRESIPEEKTEMAALNMLLEDYLKTAKPPALPSFGTNLQSHAPLQRALEAALKSTQADPGLFQKVDELNRFTNEVQATLAVSETQLQKWTQEKYSLFAVNLKRSFDELAALFKAYDEHFLRIRDEAKKIGGAPLESLRQARKQAEDESIKPIERLEAGFASASDAAPLKAEIKQRLAVERARTIAELTNRLTTLEAATVALDRRYFDVAHGGEPRFEKRHKYYLRAFTNFNVGELTAANAASAEMDFALIKEQAKRLCDEARKAGEEDAAEFLDDVTRWALRYQTNHFQRMLRDYARSVLVERRGFPLAPFDSSGAQKTLSLDDLTQTRATLRGVSERMMRAGIAESDEAVREIGQRDEFIAFLTDGEGARPVKISLIGPRLAQELKARPDPVVGKIERPLPPVALSGNQDRIRINNLKQTLYKINTSANRDIAVPSDLASFVLWDVDSVTGQPTFELGKSPASNWAPIEFLTRQPRADFKVYVGASNAVVWLNTSKAGPLLLDFKWDVPFPKSFFREMTNRPAN